MYAVKLLVDPSFSHKSLLYFFDSMLLVQSEEMLTVLQRLPVRNVANITGPAFVNSPVSITIFPLIRQHWIYDDCLEDKTEDYQNCSVLYYVTQLCTVICTLI